MEKLHTAEVELAKGKGEEQYNQSPPIGEFKYPIYVGKYDYDSRTDDGLSFKKGDQMYIISSVNDDWWIAWSKKTGMKGFIPSNYVAEYKSLDAKE